MPAKKNKTRKQMLCPQCKKAKIVFYAGGSSGLYECKGCGYIGPGYIEKARHP